MPDANSRRARVIAFYLPQFHPIPENDRWWGRGFTEWANVAKAKPLFRGHEQPILPGELGFYDLRVPETREAQAELARESGVAAFCYYHYWFGGGRRLLERPFNEVLQSKRPDFPFCLCWANESWTGIWHGSPGVTLAEQTYPGALDYEAHFAVLLPAFFDPRYLRIDGKPLFVIYRPFDIPDLSAMAARWQELARQAGLPGLHLVLHQYDLYSPHHDATIFGGYLTPRLRARDNPLLRRNLVARLAAWTRKLRGHPTVLDYEKAVEPMTAMLPDHPIPHYPCVVSNWDNTARSGRNGLVLRGSNPEKFRVHLRRAIARVSDRAPQDRIIFLKSWNEWAEGNFVEPDARFVRGYLDVIEQETRGAA